MLDQPGSGRFDALGLYASGIDTSDYAAKAAPLLREAVGGFGDFLDVGAGGGQLGRALRDPGCSWTAIEPAPVMRARLAAPGGPSRIIACGWQEAAGLGRFDTVLAANMPAPLQAPLPFLARCRGWSSGPVAWLVPAQHGPRGLCLAGCLPAEWHGEDETPGVDIVLAALGEAHRPDGSRLIDWTFSLVVADIGPLAAYLADRLGWRDTDERRPALAARLEGLAETDAGGRRLNVPRRSALLTWGCKT
ncbi:class I SAM-dependent methyltransferase [Chelatococcus reniformis]|uniref:Class I SAM-dependent methyltransferase n=1 Tax=Chelatococcus reniformis TaxID=1494448 RepID=A0A916XHX0_9HYPH|nr:class I SAM-dependent methyltransferase [Chelatococcus reniformis]GGC74679.1 hypothetical protein GCM10010994_36420 [Chelatococcus reniformis]